jgi:MIP family channel proteins
VSTIEPHEPTQPGLPRRALAEAAGTFILVFLGCGAAVALTSAAPADVGALQYPGIALAFGLGIAAAIYATGHVSGGHLNPAVSIALAVIGRLDRRDLPVYVAAQFAGATLAALALRGVFPDADALGNNAVADGVSVGSGLLVEVVLSAVFVFVIVSVATDRRVTPGFAALAIGFALTAVHLVGIPLTGTSVNPARTVGPDLVAWRWDDVWVFLVAPVIGALAGALLYQAVRPESVRPGSRPGRTPPAGG